MILEDYFKNRKNFFEAEILLVYNIFLFVLVSLIIYFSEESKRGFPFLFISFIIIFFFILDVMYQKGKINKITSFGNKWYLWFLKHLQRLLSNGKKNPKTEDMYYPLPTPRLIKQISFITIFFILPFFFAYFIVDGQWGELGSSTSYGYGKFDNEIGFSEQYNEGSVRINSAISEEFKTKLSYFFGDVLNIPILDLCFINNGTTYQEDTNFKTFNSIVSVYGKNYSVQAFSQTCIPINYESNTVRYSWLTSYEYSYQDRERINGNLDASTDALNSPKVRINELNFNILTILIAIAWIAF
ncbi:MAG: hypothetical protein KC589_02625, partial [Nanoarchaeota archaeon]|nr:hypothetical protein [Nanoarchaeota archaeon]